MALRIRKTGEILCAAHTKPEEGDTYLDDNIHYFLSVLTGAITASENQQKHYEEILNYGNPQGDPETKR
ncbi:hypothetical protein HZP50_07025 [Elizabethkingia anophelis]|nr:hypothetical protein [Elizabethkingia anophelis]MDV3585555.1 hypothetical protein [Elizabethkingia anophelis]MDV3786230.1 hypothetical protein [Elizabethkingia anophelis]